MSYTNNQNYFKRSLKIFSIAVALFLISFILSIIFNPSIDIFTSLSNYVPSTLNNSQGLNKVWKYIMHNGVQIPWQMLFLFLIPIPFLYALNMIFTSIISGVAFGFAIHLSFYKGTIMVISSLPHTLLEIIAMCFIVSCLYKLNRAIIRKICNFFRKYKKKQIIPLDLL